MGDNYSDSKEPYNGTQPAKLDDIDVFFQPPSPQLLSSPSVSALRNPLFEGWLLKKSVTIFCLPTWKKRYCIIKGGYLFKFASPASSSPKGLPIPMYGSSVSLLDTTVSSKQVLYPFQLNTLLKTYDFAANDGGLADSWADAIDKAKQIAIKQAMGHMPIDNDDMFAKQSGDYLTRKKLSLDREEMERSTGDSSVPGAAKLY